LLRIFAGSSARWTLRTVVSRDETVCKYQLEKHDVRNDGTLRYTALLPGPDGTRSVFRISGLSESDVWGMGLEKVAQIRHLPLLGRFDLIAGVVYDQELRFAVDADLSSRHAEIVGWPEEKEKKRSIAQVLAAEATVRVRPRTEEVTI